MHEGHEGHLKDYEEPVGFLKASFRQPQSSTSIEHTDLFRFDSQLALWRRQFHDQFSTARPNDCVSLIAARTTVWASARIVVRARLEYRGTRVAFCCKVCVLLQDRGAALVLLAKCCINKKRCSCGLFIVARQGGSFGFDWVWICSRCIVAHCCPMIARVAVRVAARIVVVVLHAGPKSEIFVGSTESVCVRMSSMDPMAAIALTHLACEDATTDRAARDVLEGGSRMAHILPKGRMGRLLMTHFKKSIAQRRCFKKARKYARWSEWHVPLAMLEYSSHLSYRDPICSFLLPDSSHLPPSLRFARCQAFCESRCILCTNWHCSTHNLSRASRCAAARAPLGHLICWDCAQMDVSTLSTFLSFRKWAKAGKSCQVSIARAMNEDISDIMKKNGVTQQLLFFVRQCKVDVD